VAAQVASPPYDVLNTIEARAMALDNPLSFLRVNKAELEFGDDIDPHAPQVYERARDNLARLRREGHLVQDPTPCFYLYRLTWRGRSQTGLVAITSIDEYDRGLIKKHEHTRPAKVEDRATHIMTLGAQVGPVFSAFRYDPGIAHLFAEAISTAPVVDFEVGDVRHELWVVADPEPVAKITEAFAALPHLYIADGHHRSESASYAAKLLAEKNPTHDGTEPYRYFLNVLFPDRDLRILSYNRVIRDLGGRPLAELLERASEHFEIAPASGPVDPARKHVFGMYAEGGWTTLTARDGSFDAGHPTRSIDAAILADNFLAPLLDIRDPRTDPRIDFVGGIRGISELVRRVDSGEYAMAFALHPTSIGELLAVADAGEVMPPKSTWFEPKLRSGMVVHLLDPAG
jgi:uncharacterized protein (DUF1015 family)